MSSQSASASVVTRDDILRAERQLDTARNRWNEVGRQRVSPIAIAKCDERIKLLAMNWQTVKQARLPLDRLEEFETEARSIRHGLQGMIIRLYIYQVKQGFWSYSTFLQGMFGVKDNQIWVLGLLHGVWGALAAALITIIFALGGLTFAIIASIGFTVVAMVSLLVLLRGERKGIKFVRADLDYRVSCLRSRRKEARNTITRLNACCKELKRGREVCKKLEKARSYLSRLRENSICQNEYDRAAEELKRLRRILGDERYDLLATDWQSLRGIPFEDFLARVFRSLGYQVQMTKATGDQGADVIATRNAQRLAIQAKGYSGSVGNEAVMQALAGMKHYRCDVCVVITNSRFTKHAEELALSVQCKLIDGDQIIALINGKVF
jgi:hypothetical protein